MKWWSVTPPTRVLFLVALRQLKADVIVWKTSHSVAGLYGVETS